MHRCWLCFPPYSTIGPKKNGYVSPNDDLGLCDKCKSELQEASKMICESETRGLRCQLETPHPKQLHKHERKNDVPPFETWVLTWVTDDLDVQPPYDEGCIDDSEPWIVRGEEYVG